MSLFANACSLETHKNMDIDLDQQVLDELKRSGSDLTKPHKIDFYLYFPNEQKAKTAAAQIKDKVTSADVRLGANNKDWLCFATKEMVPEHSELVRLRYLFNSVAVKLNGEYDGWETGIVK